MDMYQQQPMQIRDGGIIVVPNVQVVWQYNLVPGYSMRFIVDHPDGTMEMYRKTCYSPYEQPKVEQYDVSIRKPEAAPAPGQSQESAIESRLSALEAAIAKLTEVKTDV